jgi:thiamine-phosphate pyrophosphorylase
VTDRHALSGAPASAIFPSDFMGTGPRAIDALRQCIRDAAHAGADWIQIREKDLSGSELFELVRFAVAAARGSHTKILVNDRLDVAVAAEASGVHLGEASLPVEAVSQWRRVKGRDDFLIGASCHSLSSALKAGECGADYIYFGPVYATPSKAAYGPAQGIARLREVCSDVQIPVIAIGGITVQNAAECIAAGAAGIAAIRMFQQQQDLSTVVSRLHDISPAKKS